MHIFLLHHFHYMMYGYTTIYLFMEVFLSSWADIGILGSLMGHSNDRIHSKCNIPTWERFSPRENVKKMHSGWCFCSSTFCFTLNVVLLFMYAEVYFYNWVSSLFLHITLSILNAEIRNFSLANVAHGPKSSSRWRHSSVLVSVCS